MKTNKVLKYALSFGMLISLSTPIHATNQGWISNNGTWKYTNQDGSLSKGWKLIDGVWYVFNADGSMKTGWVASDEKWYFLGGSGVMQANKWINLNGVNYYLKGNGIMATDYIRDGFELDSTGKAVLIEQTKSVEYTQGMDLQNQIIEGNLYIDAAKFKELELNGITVNGKVVILGNNSHDSKIAIKDSTINAISSQTRGAEITLAGTTTVKSIQLEENSAIKPAEDYTGKVEAIEVQSTTKNVVEIEVDAGSVTANTFSPLTIKAKIDHLAVNKKTELIVNANIKSIVVNDTGNDTKIEVAKGIKVGSIESNVKIEIGGQGEVKKIKGENITNDTKPSRPTGGDTPSLPKGIGVSTESELLAALKVSTNNDIYLINDIKVNMYQFDVSFNYPHPVNFNLNNKELELDISETDITTPVIPGADVSTDWWDCNNLACAASINVGQRDTGAGIPLSSKNVSFKNGSIKAIELRFEIPQEVFSIEKGSSLTLDNVDILTNSVALLPRGDASQLNVVNGTKIIAGVYGVGTNAGLTEHHGVNINIDDSEIIVNSYGVTDPSLQKDNSAVFINVPGTLTISDSYIEGQRHALFVRGGTAIVTDTLINYTRGYSTPDDKYVGAWGGGNNIPSAPVIIGNSHKTSYLYPSDVTFNNVTIEGVVSDLTGNLATINGTQVVVAANTFYTGNKDVNVSFTSDKLNKLHVIQDNIKKPTITYTDGIKEHLHELVTEAIEQLEDHNLAAYEVSSSENVITSIFADGSRTIADLMNSGLFQTVIPGLINEGITDIKVNNDSITVGTITERLSKIKTALVSAIDMSEVTFDNVLNQALTTLSGKSLAITFAYDSTGSGEEVYTLNFVVAVPTNLIPATPIVDTSTSETGGNDVVVPSKDE